MLPRAGNDSSASAFEEWAMALDDAILLPTLAVLEGLHGSDVRDRLTVELLPRPAGGSDMRPARIVVRDADGAQTRYILKIIDPLGDWVSRIANDTYAREYLLTADGLLRNLPAGVTTPIVAGVAFEGRRRGVLMRDVGAHIPLPGDVAFSKAQLGVALRGLARLHDHFAGFSAQRSEELQLTTLDDLLMALSPRTTERERAHQQPGHLALEIGPAWERVAQLRPDVWAIVGSLFADRAPLIAALEGCVQTLSHGDPVAENLALDGDTLILFDWNAAGRRPGLWDVAWFVSVNVARLPVRREQALELYRAERARLGELPAGGPAWERELALCLFAAAMWSLWQKTFGLEHPNPVVRQREQAELDFWCAAVLNGQRWL
jgi:hypothetical protein